MLGIPNHDKNFRLDIVYKTEWYFEANVNCAVDTFPRNLPSILGTHISCSDPKCFWISPSISQYLFPFLVISLVSKMSIEFYRYLHKMLGNINPPSMMATH